MTNSQKNYMPVMNHEFYEQLSKLYKDLVLKLEVTQEVTQSTVEEKIKSGAAVLSYCPPEIDPSSFREAFNKVVQLFQNHLPDNSQAIKEIVANFPKTDEQLKDKIMNVLSGEQLSFVFGFEQITNKTLAAVIYTYALKPFLNAYSKYTADKYQLTNWKESNCPVCGHVAGLAILSKEEDGKRYLWCPMCDHKWSFTRVACPVCLESDPDKLGYFRIPEKDDGYKVNFCKKCKSYIKTYDEKKRITAEIDWFVEEKKTGHLDYLAIKEGFKPIG